MENEHECEVPDDAEHGGYGIAIRNVWIDNDGNMVAGNSEYVTQVNFCPFCGEEADKKIAEQ